MSVLDLIFHCLSLTQLVGKLLAYNGSGCAEPRQDRHCEGSADGKTVDKVVECIAQSYHPRHSPDAGDALASQPVAHDA